MDYTKLQEGPLGPLFSGPLKRLMLTVALMTLGSLCLVFCAEA